MLHWVVYEEGGSRSFIENTFNRFRYRIALA